MNKNNEDVWITGIGLLSSLGDGAQHHFDTLMDENAKVNVDEKTYEPYTIHKLAETQWEHQIPKKDARQMGDWQQIGTFAAGLALEDAKIDKESELASQTDMIIAARGGATDVEVGQEILKLTQDTKEQETQMIITQHLSDNLRPTFFLTQLPNLLAGNISIVHKITGSSRTFMGEEGAGIAAIQTAFARLKNKQSDIILVGGAFTAECLEAVLSMEMGKRLYKGKYQSINKRMQNNQNGMIMGTAGVFIVMERQQHAQKRNVKGYCSIENIVSDSGSRDNKNVEKRMEDLMEKIKGENQPTICSASGETPITQQEIKVLENAKNTIRMMTSKIGYTMESQFPFAVALAALAVKNQRWYPPFDENEMEYKEKIKSAMATTIGLSQAEGIAKLTGIEI